MEKGEKFTTIKFSGNGNGDGVGHIVKEGVEPPVFESPKAENARSLIESENGIEKNKELIEKSFKEIFSMENNQSVRIFSQKKNKITPIGTHLSTGSFPIGTITKLKQGFFEHYKYANDLSEDQINEKIKVFCLKNLDSMNPTADMRRAIKAVFGQDDSMGTPYSDEAKEYESRTILPGAKHLGSAAAVGKIDQLDNDAENLEIGEKCQEFEVGLLKIVESKIKDEVDRRLLAREIKRIFKLIIDKNILSGEKFNDDIGKNIATKFSDLLAVDEHDSNVLKEIADSFLSGEEFNMDNVPGNENISPVLGWRIDFQEALSLVTHMSRDDFEKKYGPIGKLSPLMMESTLKRFDEYLNEDQDEIDKFHDQEEARWENAKRNAKNIIDLSYKKKLIEVGGLIFAVDKTVKSSKTNIPGKSKNVNVIKGTDDQKIEETKYSRAGAEITLSRIDNFKELNASTLKKGDENFKEKTRELWKEFAVHGFLTKEGEFKAETDLDGKCSVALLELAGFNKESLKNIKYIPQGATEDGAINIDTGGKEGVVIERKTGSDGLIEWRKTAHIDHHAKESKSRSSATRNMYKMLVDMGLLEDSKSLDRMVHFVTRMDSGEYPGMKKYFDNSHKTIAGLQQYITKENLIKFFTEDENPDPTRILNEDELQKYGFIGSKDKNGKDINRVKQQKTRANLSKSRLEKIKRLELVVSSERYGNIAINFENFFKESMGKKNLPGDFVAANAFGYDTLITWNPSENNFKISSTKVISDDFPQGFKVREKMWVKSYDDKTPLTFTLQDILNKMTDGKFEAKGKLKEYFETGKIIIEDEINGKSDNNKTTEKLDAKKEIIEKPKEKTVIELYSEANEKAFGELSVQSFQFLKEDRKNTLLARGASLDVAENGAKRQIEKDIDYLVNRYGEKKGEELEKVVQYILGKLK